ncbi:MAG TPA: response regulator [Rhodopila sp.]
MPAGPAPAVAGQRNARILVVDDDNAVRETLAELLEDEGFSCVTAGDAIEALMVLRQTTAVDALVTDLTMPGHDGIMLIRQAREINSALPAILLTGYAEQVASVSTIAGGNFHVLRKPVQSDRLIQEIELLVARGQR